MYDRLKIVMTCHSGRSIFYLCFPLPENPKIYQTGEKGVEKKRNRVDGILVKASSNKIKILVFFI